MISPKTSDKGTLDIAYVYKYQIKRYQMWWHVIQTYWSFGRALTPSTLTVSVWLLPRILCRDSTRCCCCARTSASFLLRSRTTKPSSSLLTGTQLYPTAWQTKHTLNTHINLSNPPNTLLDSALYLEPAEWVLLREVNRWVVVAVVALPSSPVCLQLVPFR